MLRHPQTLPSILGDDRFKVMFENPEYQVDEQSEEFRLLNPIVSKVGKKRMKKLRLMAAAQQVSRTGVITLLLLMAAMGRVARVFTWLSEHLQVAEDEEEPEGRASSEEESSDDDKSWVEEVREQRRLLRQEDRDRRRQERKEADRGTVLLENGQSRPAAEEEKANQPQFYQIRAGEEFRSFNDVSRKQKLQKYDCGNALMMRLLTCVALKNTIALGFAAVQVGQNVIKTIIRLIPLRILINPI